MALTSYLGDRYHVRGPLLISNALIALIGLPIMGFAHSPHTRYFGVFLLTAGSNANIPVALAYQANNVRGQWKRALTSALFVGFVRSSPSKFWRMGMLIPGFAGRDRMCEWRHHISSTGRTAVHSRHYSLYCLQLSGCGVGVGVELVVCEAESKGREGIDNL